MNRRARSRSEKLGGGGSKIGAELYYRDNSNEFLFVLLDVAISDIHYDNLEN